MLSSPSCYVTADGQTLNLVWEARTEEFLKIQQAQTREYSWLITIIPPSCPNNPPILLVICMLSIAMNLVMEKMTFVGRIFTPKPLGPRHHWSDFICSVAGGDPWRPSV